MHDWEFELVACLLQHIGKQVWCWHAQKLITKMHCSLIDCFFAPGHAGLNWTHVHDYYTSNTNQQPLQLQSFFWALPIQSRLLQKLLGWILVAMYIIVLHVALNIHCTVCIFINRLCIFINYWSTVISYNNVGLIKLLKFFTVSRQQNSLFSK